MKKHKGLTLFLLLSVLLFGCARSLSKDVLLSNQGLQEISRGNYPQAERYLKQSLMLNPKNPYALLNMGVVYQNTEKPEQAREMYRKVITLNPKEKAGHSNKGSGVGKTLADLAWDNLKLLGRRRSEAPVSTTPPRPKNPPISQAKKSPPMPRAEERPQPMVKNRPTQTKAKSLSPATDWPLQVAAKQRGGSHYRVQKGDTLFKIAGREDIYGDSLEWPNLYWLNQDQLKGLKSVVDFQHKELAEGLYLKYGMSEKIYNNPLKAKSNYGSRQAASPRVQRVAVNKRATGQGQGTARRTQQQARKVEEGHYRIKKGDTLFKIAGRKDVYGDPLKWPSLYRLNLDKLGQLKLTENFQHQALSGGVDLKFVTIRQAAQNLTQLGSQRWAVNVLSAQNSETIIKPALTLMKKGYHVYITKAKVQGRDWLRFRVGFFRDDREAATEGKKILSLLSSNKRFWVVKVPNGELKRFGGY